jgi:hypothetical protein
MESLDRRARLASLLAMSADVFACAYAGLNSDVREALGQITESEFTELDGYFEHRRQRTHPTPEQQAALSAFQAVLEGVRRQRGWADE